MVLLVFTSVRKNPIWRAWPVISVCWEPCCKSRGAMRRPKPSFDAVSRSGKKFCRRMIPGSPFRCMAWPVSTRRKVAIPEAEPLLKRAVANYEAIEGRDHITVGAILDDLALLYQLQGRYREAEPIYLRSLTIAENWHKAEHPQIAYVCNHLAGLYLELQRYDEAEKYSRRGLAIREQLLGPDHDLVADSLIEMGRIPPHSAAIHKPKPTSSGRSKSSSRQRGPNSPRVADALNQQSRLYCAMGKFTEAEPLADRVLSIRDRAMVSPGERSAAYADRARISWELGRKSEAIADLKQVLELAEEQRGQVAGAEHERAAAFAEYAKPFEQMVAWQVELGDFGEALSAMERSCPLLAVGRDAARRGRPEPGSLNHGAGTTERR